MIIKMFPVKTTAKFSLRFPPVESWYAARTVHFGAFFAGCPAGTEKKTDKCCVPFSNWDGLDKRCVLEANNPIVVTSQGGKMHLKAGGGGGGTPCTPNCGGGPSPTGGTTPTRQCGDDGCGGSCGTCQAGTECYNGSCVPDTTGGGGTSTGSVGGGGGGGTSVSIGGSGSGFDVNAFLESPVVWIAGGLLLVAVTYRIFKGKSPAASPVTVVR